jgi:hypothetical protein
LYGEDSGEFTLVDAENLRQGSPGSTEEEGVKLTVVLKEELLSPDVELETTNFEHNQINLSRTIIGPLPPFSYLQKGD